MTKKSKEDEKISAGLNLKAYRRSQAKCLQTSYIKRIKVFFFAI